MPTHSYCSIPPHLYPRIPPRQVFLCLYCTSNPTYAPYVVPNYPHIPPFGYLNTPSSRLPSYVLSQHSKKICEYRINRSNIRSNEQKTKIRLSMSIREEFYRELFSVSIDESHEDLGWHKGISFLLSPKTTLLIQLKPPIMNFFSEYQL